MIDIVVSSLFFFIDPSPIADMKVLWYVMCRLCRVILDFVAIKLYDVSEFVAFANMFDIWSTAYLIRRSASFLDGSSSGCAMLL